MYRYHNTVRETALVDTLYVVTSLGFVPKLTKVPVMYTPPSIAVAWTEAAALTRTDVPTLAPTSNVSKQLLLIRPSDLA